ncbi:HAD hydrolase family protein [Thioalkalivibrio sp. XN8]|uniref:KdsC family phosphatase n=1 Tax=Thioalkalivibrio sp. XN8 TaxID=2712863 RepID=UPI0013EDFBD4|nr:HAD hydrolase family protein [Thioalkalivibrio sp. XN8]NGP52200.1 HAD hydrolase family protein [Thioalkalivibrio sp. XN8]
MVELARRAARIRLAVFDVDGVFTDGRIWLGSDGVEYKSFSVRDGYGIKALLAAGVEVAIISGRDSPAVNKRMGELGVTRVIQGRDDKATVLEQLLRETGIPAAEVAYLGDDIPDVPAMQMVGLPATVADAQAEALAASDWVSSRPGGRGAVREFCELLLGAR